MENDLWPSITDYSNRTGRSISTIRRYIKSGKVVTKKIAGKFYIKMENNDDFKPFKTNNTSMEQERKILALKDEIAELKMLVSLYEVKEMPSLPIN